MNKFANVLAAGAVALALLVFAASTRAAVAGAPETITFSAEPTVSVNQHQVYDAVHLYERSLNSADTATIVGLFAPSGVAEWNDKRTYATPAELTGGYSALFKIAKFSTVFSYDSILVSGDIAVVRTHHHAGATVVENGKEVLDKNREAFVLQKIDGKWKIVLYTFNTDPMQGEG